MSDLIIRKTEGLSGKVEAPPSKALTHRAVIAASLSEGRSAIDNPLICEDTEATLRACEMLGAHIEKTGARLLLEGFSRPRTPPDVIDCRDSGSTIRFLAPLCALVRGISVLTGGESLRNRPMGPLLEALQQLGVKCGSTRGDDKPPILIFGSGLKGGKATIRGDVSSQFISGLLFATPKAESTTEIQLTTALESKPYVDLTVNTLKKHGIKVFYEDDWRFFSIPGAQEYKPFNHRIEGDYSSAAFLMAAAAITDSTVEITGLNSGSLQGDREIVEVLRRMGVKIEVKGDSVFVEGEKGNLKGVSVDVRNTPDLAPVYMVLGCLAEGRTVLQGVKRLRWKESDRVSAMVTELKKMGGQIEEGDNRLVIKGASKLKGAVLSSHGDHRVAMACTVAALSAEGRSVVKGIECISKSYPNFIRDLGMIGGSFLVR